MVYTLLLSFLHSSFHLREVSKMHSTASKCLSALLAKCLELLAHDAIRDPRGRCRFLGSFPACSWPHKSACEQLSPKLRVPTAAR